ncbi:MAG: alpha-L-fucosidase [Acidobacteriota bacterium]|nr:alpha-L-fucosidase [Acidobacteriota bacterium]
MKTSMTTPLVLALVAAASASTLQAQDYTAKVHQQVARVEREDATGRFHADWKSLAAYQTPEWFQDAKFGIFLHWGVYSVPAFGSEWYSRNMYVPGTPDFAHHVATYGPQAKFGYKDFIPMFRAEKFDADAWVSLFQQAGARYIVPVAEHCDGFPMYDSSFTDWDAARMGPHRDVVGEIARATRAHGLHFGASSHRAEHWWWYGLGRTFDSDVNDPRYAGLYGPAAPMALPGTADSTKEPNPDHLEQWLPPDDAFLADWLARSTEIVDKYHPEFVYFDWWDGQPRFQPYLQRFAAYYYNRSAEQHLQPVLTYKLESMPANTGTLDIERGKMDNLRLLPWQTDTSISIHSWGYVENDQYRDARSLIHQLVDTVSKNGNLLLNVGPRADGTIPEQAQAVLREMGAWLKVYGEAIYNTRPWVLYGEGPSIAGRNATAMNSDVQAFTARDIRFTVPKGGPAGVVYATVLGRPQDGDIRIQTMGSTMPYLPGPVCSVTLLGSQAPPVWQQRSDGLHLTAPAAEAHEIAYVYRIQAAHACH